MTGKSSTSTSLPEPGWYPEASRNDVSISHFARFIGKYSRRWWDGEKWTGQWSYTRAPVAAAPTFSNRMLFLFIILDVFLVTTNLTYNSWPHAAFWGLFLSETVILEVVNFYYQKHNHQETLYQRNLRSQRGLLILGIISLSCSAFAFIVADYRGLSLGYLIMLGVAALASFIYWHHLSPDQYYSKMDKMLNKKNKRSIPRA